MTEPGLKIDADDFALLGLPQRFALERAQLDARWRSVQAAVHPDRFAADSGAAQRVALQWATRINEAHRRLKEPLSRAAYLCELRGAAIGAESNTTMPRDFLMQQMASREALEEAAGEPALRALAASVAARERELFGTVARQLDVEDDAAGAAQTVRALMFVARFRSDVERRLEALEHNG